MKEHDINAIVMLVNELVYQIESHIRADMEIPSAVMRQMLDEFRRVAAEESP